MAVPDRYFQIAHLHVANISQGFLATLGVSFLALLYRAIDDAEDGVLLVEERGTSVVGFVSGSLGIGPIFRRMLRNPLPLAWALLPSLVRPSRVKRIFDILRYGRDESAPNLPNAELLSIAVDPRARRTGVAEGLYRRFEEDFRRRGVKSFRITVGEPLASAHRYYQRMGAKPVQRIEVHAGEPSIVYVQDISD